jgi:hypothetical protein
MKKYRRVEAMNAKRGFMPEDEQNFSPKAITILKKASRHILYLINEGYDLKQATVFVGNHFMLSERQRLSIMRSVASREQLSVRQKKRVSFDELAGHDVWIDGFNTIITLEVLLSDSLVFYCMDSTIRDLAALRGTYRLIPESTEAVQMMLDVLRDSSVSKINILLDETVSNSGRLKALIADIAEIGGYEFNLDIQILRDVDRTLYDKELVITSDSVILDHCRSWVNLTAECVKQMEYPVFQVW